MTESKKYIYESPDGGKTIYRRELDQPHSERELVEEFSWPLMKDCITTRGTVSRTTISDFK